MKKIEDEVKKTGMMKSHLERMSEPRKSYSKELCSDYKVHQKEQVVENGRLVYKMTVCEVHPQDRYKGLKASDFALENIIAVGAVDSLKECQYGSNTRSELSDFMEGSIDNIISAVDSAEASFNNNNNEGGDE